MNKKLIAIATAAALALPVTAVQASDVSVSGFADTTFVISDDSADPVTGPNLAEKKFHTNGEIDVIGTHGAVTGRIDLDVSDGSTYVEQSFVSWAANEQFSLVIGKMNNPAGLEAEDAPNMFAITNGQIHAILDGQSSTAAGNTVEGALGVFNFGAASVTVGILDELHGVPEENSYVISATGEVIPGLNIEGTFISQEDPTGAQIDTLIAATTTTYATVPSAGNLFDINGTFSPSQMAGLTVAAEFATASEIIDTAWGVWGMYAFNPMFSATVRYDNVSFSDLKGTTTTATASDDVTSLTLAVAAEVSENLAFLLEWRNDDDSTTDNAMVQLEAIVTLGDFE